jgi:arylsulfatase A-like enzyme
VPYYFEGANWDHNDNPGQAFQEVDRSDECRYRQRLACEYVDKQVAGLIERFKHATILVCADHGDCWGEDGLWEHGIAHPMTLTVPLMLRVAGMPVSRENAEEVAARVKDVLKTANPSQPEVSHQLGKLRRRIKRTAREAKSK